MSDHIRIYNEVHEIKEHIHSRSITYPTNLTTPVRLVVGAAANQPGNWTILIAASTLSADYDIHYCSAILSANDTYGIEFSYGATNIMCGEVPPLVRTASITSFSGVPVLSGDENHNRIPYNQILYGRVRSAGGGAVNYADIFVSVHEY